MFCIQWCSVFLVLVFPSQPPFLIDWIDLQKKKSPLREYFAITQYIFMMHGAVLIASTSIWISKCFFEPLAWELFSGKPISAELWIDKTSWLIGLCLVNDSRTEKMPEMWLELQYPQTPTLHLPLRKRINQYHHYWSWPPCYTYTPAFFLASATLMKFIQLSQQTWTDSVHYH